MAIFSKFFGDVMSHIIRSNADKIINTIPELFIKQKIVFNFVYFSSAQTLEPFFMGTQAKALSIKTNNSTVQIDQF